MLQINEYLFDIQFKYVERNIQEINHHDEELYVQHFLQLYMQVRFYNMRKL